MHLALIEGDRVAPTKGISAICPCCGGAVVAKCGDYKIHHWAHKSLEGCDPWWERETEWHRTWKNRFPLNRHEWIMTDKVSGEKHIADVYTEGNTVIEFQHSAIKPEEVKSREGFYMQEGRKMIWVVDGNTGFNLQYFGLSLSGKIELETDVTFSWFSRSKIFHRWSKSKAFVLFDFHDGMLWQLKKFDPERKDVTLNLRSIKKLLTKA